MQSTSENGLVSISSVSGLPGTGASCLCEAPVLPWEMIPHLSFVPITTGMAVGPPAKAGLTVSAREWEPGLAAWLGAGPLHVCLWSISPERREAQ